MTEIRCGRWRIKATSRGWTLSEIKVRQSGDHEGEEYASFKGDYGDLEAVLRALQDTHMRECGATSFEELRQELVEFRAWLTSVFALRVAE